MLSKHFFIRRGSEKEFSKEVFLEQWFSAVPQGIFGNVCRYFSLSQLGIRGANSIKWVGYC